MELSNSVEQESCKSEISNEESHEIEELKENNKISKTDGFNEKDKFKENNKITELHEIKEKDSFTELDEFKEINKVTKIDEFTESIKSKQELREMGEIDFFMNFLKSDSFKDQQEIDVFYEFFISNVNDLEDPRFYLPTIIDHFKTQNSFLVSQALFILISSYDVEYNNFYEIFFNFLSEQVIETHKTVLLSFLKIILTEKNISLRVVMAYIKKLARISLNVSSERALEILHLIFILMRYFPVCLEMTHSKSFVEVGEDVEFGNFQHYLFEFDILETGINPIRNMIHKIRRYTPDAKNKIDPRTYLDEGYGPGLEIKSSKKK